MGDLWMTTLRALQASYDLPIFENVFGESKALVLAFVDWRSSRYPGLVQIELPFKMLMIQGFDVYDRGLRVKFLSILLHLCYRPKLPLVTTYHEHMRSMRENKYELLNLYRLWFHLKLFLYQQLHNVPSTSNNTDFLSIPISNSYFCKGAAKSELFHASFRWRSSGFLFFVFL